MKPFAIFALTPAIVALSQQTTLPAALTTDFSKLGSAKSFHAHYTFSVNSVSQGQYDLSMSRDNRFRLDYPGGFVLSDGQNVYEYTKATNSYTRTAFDNSGLSSFLKRPEVFPWRPFFDTSPEKRIQSAQMGGHETVNGKDVQDVAMVVGKAQHSATLYIDPSTGVAWGARLESDKVYVEQADQLTLSDQPDSADKYAFVAPDGALEAQAASSGPTYAQVQQLLTNNCMPCHNSQNQRAGYDLTNYNGVTQIVSAGKSSDSLLIKALRGQGADLMPRGRAQLAETDIELIAKWIDAGAKNDN